MLKQNLWVTTILILALIFRLVSIDQSLWLDEATTGLVAQITFPEIFSNFLPGDFHPPLYYLAIKIWTEAFGYGEFALRSISLLSGLGTVYLTYLIGLTLADRRVGLVAALFLATSGLHIYYSHEARMYALVAFWVSLAAYFFIKAEKKTDKKHWMGFSLSLLLSTLTHYMAFLVLPVFLLYGLWKRKARDWWVKFAVWQSLIAMVWIIWVPSFINQISSGLKTHTTSPLWWNILGRTTIREIVLVPTKFILGRIDFYSNAFYALVVVIVGILFSVFLLKSLLSSEREKVRIVWFWLLTPVALAALVGLIVPVFSYFRLLFVLPAFYLLVAHGISNLKKEYVFYTVAAVVFVNLATSFYYLTNPRFHREGWREMVNFIHSSSESQRTIVLFPADSQMEAYNYYLLQRKAVQVDNCLDCERLYISPESFESADFETDYQTIWLVRYVQTIFDPEDSTRQSVEQLGYNKVAEYDFNGVVVWRYGKPGY